MFFSRPGATAFVITVRGPSWDFSRTSLHPPSLQTKLKIGAVDDPLEHEADRIADQVVRPGDRALPATAASVAPTSGQPLDPAMRAFFEPRFGADFSSVRVHAGDA